MEPLPISKAALERLSPKERAQAEALLKARAEALEMFQDVAEADPLQTFRPNCAEQERFLLARTKTQAAFCGNQAGKTTGLVVKCLIQVTPSERLPESLRRFKFTPDGHLIEGRFCAPAINERIIRPFRQWCPKHILKNGSFDDSWKAQDKILVFNDGSFIDFLSYETDLDKFGTVQRHFIGYDEPPPQDIRDEGLARLIRYSGPEMFAMTPLKANTGWTRREIWRKREDPQKTVCKWSIHDNTALPPADIAYFLDNLPNDLWRAAREFGDFVEVGGLMYPRFEDWVLKDIPVDPDGALRALQPRVQNCDVVVSIDPGLRNAAFTWNGFDRDNRQLVFDEDLLQQSYPEDYAKAIRARNARWGLKESEITYVIDPAYAVRSQASGDNVESALAREGIYCVGANNNVEAGVMEVNQRGNGGMLEVSPALVGLRDEADEYAMEDREDGVFREKRNDNSHRLDTVRYASMYHTWHPAEELAAPTRALGWIPGEAPPIGVFFGQKDEPAPMGFMS